VREKDGSIHTELDHQDHYGAPLYERALAGRCGAGCVLLRGPDNLDDYVAEVPPYGGNAAGLPPRRQFLAWP